MMATGSTSSLGGLEDLVFLSELVAVARKEHGFGKPETRRFWKHFACMASNVEFDPCASGSSCPQRCMRSTYCKSNLCSSCCTDDFCVGCDYHRLVAEFECRQLPGEPDEEYRARVSSILAAAVTGNVRLDYGSFARTMQGDDEPEPEVDRPAQIPLALIARPVSASVRSLVDAVHESLQPGSPVSPRLCMVKSFSSQNVSCDGVTPRVQTIVYLCTRMFVLPQREVSVYRAACAHPTAIRARSVFIRDNLSPLEFGTHVEEPSGGAAAASSPTQIVFDDDLTSQAMTSGRDGRPTVLLLHTVRTTDDAVLKFATCSCNEVGVQHVDDLVDSALTRDSTGPCRGV